MTTPSSPTRDGLLELAARLTKAQRKGLLGNAVGRGSSSYTLGVTLNTCEALASKGLVRRVAGVGAFYSPRTAILWPFTPLGLAVREILASEQER